MIMERGEHLPAFPSSFSLNLERPLQSVVVREGRSRRVVEVLRILQSVVNPGLGECEVKSFRAIQSGPRQTRSSGLISAVISPYLYTITSPA